MACFAGFFLAVFMSIPVTAFWNHGVAKALGTEPILLGPAICMVMLAEILTVVCFATLRLLQALEQEG